jgi:hypothetical protein
LATPQQNIVAGSFALSNPSKAQMNTVGSRRFSAFPDCFALPFRFGDGFVGADHTTLAPWGQYLQSKPGDYPAEQDKDWMI